MKTKTFFTFLAIIFIALFSCKKDFDSPTGGNKIEFGNTTVDSVSYFWVQITTQFTSTGGNTISQHGHCWSIENEPTIKDNHTSLGKLEKPKTFQSELEELSSNTTYFIRSYFTYQNGTVYGTQETITTLKTGKPVIITSAVTDITLISAVCGGTVVSDSGLVVTARGICWDTISDFNIDSCLNKTINGDSLGTFTSNITELTDGKDYFVKAYATNEKGTSYGELKTFSTVPLSVPEVQTSNISGITTNSAVGGGEVVNNGNGTVTARGICWSTSENVSLENYDGITENGTGTGSFISNLTDLTDGTFYYVLAYAINEKGVGYGPIKSFQTVAVGAPTVITSNVTDITTTSAQCGGNVTNSGNGTVTARGVCWNTTGNPTLENCLDYTENGNGLGEFNSSLIGLNDGTTYYVSAYATNEVATGYGAVKSFNTIEITIPDVTTFEVTNITQNSAECGGNVTSNGNGTVIARGVCWNTSGNPTLENCESFTEDGSGTGEFTSNITGLNFQQQYYTVAYATNEEGTAYGEIRNFTTTLAIGDIYAGGIVFYLDGSAGGLVCAESNQSTNAEWGCYLTTIGGTSTVIGSGSSNTAAIVAGCNQSGIAARICNDLVLNGYDDWFLPSKDELNLMYKNLHLAGIGGFGSDYYWSSSEISNTTAWGQYFYDGSQENHIKLNDNHVRAVRAF